MNLIENKNVLILGREDLALTFAKTPIFEIQYQHFRHPEAMELQKNGIVLFTDVDGNTIVIKNRYGGKTNLSYKTPESLRDLYSEYKENQALDKFSIYHFYPGEVIKEGAGIVNHRWIKVVGFNFETKEFCRLCSQNPERFDEIRLLEMVGPNKIKQMGYWHDGSFFISFLSPMIKPDIFNTFYITDNKADEQDNHSPGKQGQ